MVFQRTIGTRSAFTLSLPTGESGQRTDGQYEGSEEYAEYSTADTSRESSLDTGRTSDTSQDFSSFKNLSQISEHTTMRPRDDDVAWMDAVRQYHQNEPVFRKKPFVCINIHRNEHRFIMHFTVLFRVQ
ncbi:unnamed protein product [Gongylonema pulchrum]|uniref:PHM7_ext domain-containing protein n=1 Tax=Gongylonema pulchrum TaxID=637853 RepID=A0A183D9M6_9BILA|nr:unnamed protein product [Gongylonema pulchrum]